MHNVWDLAGQNYNRLTKWVCALPVSDQARLFSVTVSNRWKEGGMTVGPPMPCTSESFSKKTNPALQLRLSFGHLILLQGKSGQCLHFLLSQAIHSPCSGARIVLPASCLAAVTAGLNDISMPRITFAAHSHLVANYCKCSAASPGVQLLLFGTKSELGVHFRKSLKGECQI